MTGDIRAVVFENEVNQIALATHVGFSIFDAGSTAKLSDCRLGNPNFPQGVRLISTLGNSNIVAVVPMSATAQSVYIWDRVKNVSLADVSFGDPVFGVRLRPDILVAATSKRISVRGLSDFSEIASFEPAFNREGIFDIPATFSSSLLAFPSPDIGVASIADYLDSSVRHLHVHAFKTPITFLKFSDNGRLLAVAGDEGKEIAVFSVPSMRPVATLRRTVGVSRILSMSFEPHGTQLAVTSLGAGLNVFYIAWPDQEQEQKAAARTSIKIKDCEAHPGWAWFSAKTLRLCGVTLTGQQFKVSFTDDQVKTAVLEVDFKPLAFK
jgi:WD40 repeat protein